MRCLPYVDFLAGGAGRTSWLTGRARGAVRLVWLAVLGSALLMAGLALLQTWQVSREAANWRAKVAQQEEQRRAERSTRQTAGPALSAAQREGMAGVAARLNVDWAGLLDELERQTPLDVALIEIEPQAALGRLRLLVETRTSAALFAYLEALNASSLFHEARLASHETYDRDDSRPLRFVVWVRVGAGRVGSPEELR